MISVEEAKIAIQREVRPGKAVQVDLPEALGLVLADEVISPLDFPLFHSSAMDGYALRHADLTGAGAENPVTLKVTGLVFAGDEDAQAVGEGQAVRIMTGAPLPAGATAVVRQEDVEAGSDDLMVFKKSVAAGENVRCRGEELKVGDVALERGTVVTPAVVGFLAGLGVRELPVHRPPRVSVVSTGSELVRERELLSPGKILDSNSPCLAAALKQLNLKPQVFLPVGDEPDLLHAILSQALEKSDVVLLSGGISVGERDYVRDVVSELGGQSLFWKIAQKPGKPFYFAKLGQKLIFGVPGNPASALTCFVEYIAPATKRWLGFDNTGPQESRARLTDAVNKKAGLTHFLRARVQQRFDGLWVTPWSDQGSHRMGSFAHSNCLIVLPAEVEKLNAGESVNIHWL